MTFRRDLIIEWGDCDPAGIVFFPRYLAMFDASTARMIEAAAGLKKIDLIKAYDVSGWGMVDLHTRFLLPCRYGDEATIESSIVEIGRSSFQVRHRLRRDGSLAVEALEKRVLIRPDADGVMRARPIPPALRTALETMKQADATVE